MTYGYLHRGRVIEPDVTTGGYFVEIPTLAPTRRMGPFPSLEPNLPAGQRVVLASLGTSRDELVIVGRVPGVPPTIAQIPGLQAALDGKADDADITALDARLDIVEPIVSSHTATLASHTSTLASHTTSIATNTTNIATNTSSITSLDTRVTAVEAKIGYVIPVSSAAGRPTSGLYDGYPIFRTDKGFLEFYDLANTKWRVRGTVSVGALADITDPLTDQVVLLTTDKMLYRYTGSAWLAVEHTASGGGFAKYYRTSAQSNAIVAATWTRQAYNVALNTSSDVTPNGSFDQFTLNRAGVWDIRATNRAGVTNVDPVRYLIGIFPGATPGTSPYAVETENEPLASTNSTNLGVSVERSFSAGDVICVAINRTGNSGSGGGNNAATEISGEANQITMRWLGP